MNRFKPRCLNNLFKVGFCAYLTWVGTLICPAEESEVFVEIILDTGGNLSGVAKKITDRGVLLDMGFGDTFINRDSITKIFYPTGAVLENMRKERDRLVLTPEESEQARRKTAEDIRIRNERFEEMREKALFEASRKREYIVNFEDPRRIIANARIDGKRAFPLLVDTGADHVVIPLRVARDLGYEVRRPSRTVPVVLADGTVRQAVPITLRSVQVEGLKANNVAALVVLPVDGTGQVEMEYGLLGMSYLNRFNILIDNVSKKMKLRRK